MSVFSRKRPYSIMDDQWYTVDLKVVIWSEIYGGKLSYSFPNEKSALRFAKGNVTPQTPCARVYSPKGLLIDAFGNLFA